MNYFWSILTSNGNSEFLALLALAAAKSTVLLAFAALICLLFRRFSAATRHLLFSFVLCASMLLPCLSFLTIWEVPILPASQQFVKASGLDESAKYDELNPKSQTEFNEGSVIRENFEAQLGTGSPDKTSFDLNNSNLQAPPLQNAAFFSLQTANGVLIVWFGGVILLFIRLLIGFSATALLARRAVEFKDMARVHLFSSLAAELDLEGKVRLLRSEQTLMPIVCGILRPAILLPASADQWSRERLRLVLLHELTHVARRDCLTQILAQLACAFYWFNPLVWYAARQLRLEREKACDERVLGVGTKPSEYAHHLLEIARSMQDRSVFEWSNTTTVAMARKSQFEGRLLAILSNRSERCPMPRLLTASVMLLIGSLFFSLALIRPIMVNAGNLSASKNEISTEITRAETPPSDVLSETASEKLAGFETLEEKPKKPIEKPEIKTADVVNASLQQPSENPVSDEPKGEISVDPNIKPNDAPQPEAALGQNSNTSPNLQDDSIVKVQYTAVKQEKSGDFIDEMASVGFTNLSIDDLIALKTYRVTADFVRGLQALGYSNLTPKTVVNLRIYNVTPAFIEAMAAAGYKGLSLKELTSARIYKATPEYVQAMRAAGYPSLSFSQLIEFKIYNITPELARTARARLGDLTPKQLVSLKISGVFNQSKNKDKE